MRGKMQEKIAKDIRLIAWQMICYINQGRKT